MVNIVAKKETSFEDLDPIDISNAVMNVLKPAYNMYGSHERLIKDTTILLFECRHTQNSQHAICAEYMLRIRNFFIESNLKKAKPCGEVFTDHFWIFSIEDIIEVNKVCVDYLSERINYTKEYEDVYFKAETLLRSLIRSCTYMLELHEASIQA